MARRKSGYLSDGSSDSNASDDGDADDARDSQDDEFGPRRKKRKVDREQGKSRAWEGIFGEDDDEPSYGRGGRGGRGGGRGGATSTGSSRFKAPSFVAPKNTAPIIDPEPELEVEPSPVQEPAAPEEQDDQDMDIDNSSSGDTDESDESSESRRRRARSPIVREDSEDETPAVGLGGGGGIGSSARKAETAAGFTKAGAPPRGGIGFSAAGSSGGGAGIGARPAAPARTESSLLHGGIGSKPRAELEEDEQEALYPSDPSHAMPHGFGGARGFRNGGIGSSASASSSRSNTPQPQAQRQQRSFVIPSSAASTSTAPRADVTAKDLKYLNSISMSLGARLLAKQGWVAGKGLGKEEDGKAVPIEANIGISRGQGIGKGVRTEQSRREARAKGEKFSSDEEEEARKERKKARSKAKADAASGLVDGEQLGKGENASWRKSKKVKVKVEHKSYEQLLAEAGESGQHAGIGKVLDARSGELKEVSSIAALSLSSWTPTTDQTRLPELRHNLRLILDVTKGDVLSLAKEGKGVNDRRKWNLAEEKKLRAEQKEEEDKIDRLKVIQDIVKTLITKVSALDGEGPEPLTPLAGDFTLLLEEYRSEYEDYDLDEVVVGAIAQVLAKSFRSWQPLDPSDNLVDILKQWKPAYRYSEAVADDRAVESYENYRNGAATTASTVMTPFESLLNALWLPKVRSAINNDCDPRYPQQAVSMLENWWPILPRFMRDNVLDQLVLPKLRDEIKRWSPRTRKGREPFSLAAVVFPWLSLLGPMADDLLEEAKLKVGEALKKWTIVEGVPEELPLWREVFSRGKWDTLILLNILPKLSAHLADAFEVNPRDQQMGPLDTALAWSSLMRDSIFVQLLEERFFPKWLDTLHFWLIQPNYSAGEVATWYNRWKDHLGQSATSDEKKLTDAPGVEHGLRYGLHLMNDAMALGEHAPTKLAKVDYKPYQGDKRKKEKSKSSSKSSRPSTRGPMLPDVSFRSIAEQHAAQHDLMFVPTGRSHATTGKPLFKVSKSADGRGGATVYIGDDAVYALVEEGKYRAVLLEDMVKMGLR